MEKNNQQTQNWIWAVIIIVVIGIVIFFAFGNKTKLVDDTVTPIPTVVVPGTPTTTEPESVQDIDVATPGAATISYTNALVKYADRRIQLDKACQAYPNTVSYKDNTGVMIDNRSSQTRTIKIGTTFTIKPWGFKILVLPDVYLKNKTILVDCDKSQNVATILIQE